MAPNWHVGPPTRESPAGLLCRKVFGPGPELGVVRGTSGRTPLSRRAGRGRSGRRRTAGSRNGSTSVAPTGRVATPRGRAEGDRGVVASSPVQATHHLRASQG